MCRRHAPVFCVSVFKEFQMNPKVSHGSIKNIQGYFYTQGQNEKGQKKPKVNKKKKKKTLSVIQGFTV